MNKSLLQNRLFIIIAVTAMVAVATALFLSWYPRNKGDIKSPVYTFQTPRYDMVMVEAVFDTLHFPLDEIATNQVKSFNYFAENDTAYIAFYDQRSQTISIYHFNSRQQTGRVELRPYFNRFYKTTAYVKNRDSIFVNNSKSFYMIRRDTLVKKIPFLEKPESAWAIFESSSLPVLNGQYVYAAVRPYADEKSLKALREWRVFYVFDLKKRKASLRYGLPPMFRENLYGHRFFDMGYCYNDSNRFVLSFPGDTLLYETDLDSYHHSYYAKSRLQQEAIHPVGLEALENDEGGKNYMLRDSYGPVYFDPVEKKYLRVAYSKISADGYASKQAKRQQRLIIFDEQLRIIGESPIDGNIMLSTLFFTREGHMYARINPADEYALHFIRLAYAEPYTGRAQSLSYENK